MGKQDMKTQLLTKSPKDLLFQLAIPGIIGMVVIGLYPFMDGIFAGWIIGDYAMSAISISMSLTIINGGVSALIGVGSASILSRAIGKGDKETTDKIFGNFCYWGILMAATMRLYMFSFIPLWGMSQGLQPVIGANFGAKQYKRVKDTMKVFMYGATILAALSWIPSMFYSEKLLSLFSVRSEIIEAGVMNFKMFYSTFIMYGIMIMTLTFFQSIGDGKKASMIVMLRQLILFIPAILLLPKFFGASAVWWAEPIVDFSMIMLGLFLMLNGLRKMGKDKA